jgi:hypothetical protein
MEPTEAKAGKEEVSTEVGGWPRSQSHISFVISKRIQLL